MVQYLNTIILLQIPIVMSIVIIGGQTPSIYKNYKLVNIGWLINLFYIVITFIGKRFNIDIGKQLWFTASSDLASCYFFLLGTLPYTKLGKPFSNVRHIRLYLSALFLFALLFRLLGLFSKFDLGYIDIYTIPTVILDLMALSSLALYFKKLSWKYNDAKVLFLGTLLYTCIQTIYLFKSPSEGLSLSEQAQSVLKLLESVGFLSGFVAKFLILIGLSRLLINTYREYSNINHELAIRKAVSIKLSTILGRTFHEVIPVLLETETVTDRLLYPDETKQLDLRISKGTRRELELIDSSLHRALTIITASIKMYHSDILDKVEEAQELPIPITEEIKVQNINTLIQVAIMNYKATVSERSANTMKFDSSDHFFTNEIKFHTQYGGNCDILCNSVQIVQIFYNLFKNSHEACEAAKIDCQIFIRSKNHFWDDNGSMDNKDVSASINQELNTHKRGVKFILVEIEDNGPGIPKELFDKVFELGFSTKENKGKGRGFGLEIVKTYTAQNSGTVSIESPVEKPMIKDSYGTKFIFNFKKETK